MLDLVQAALGPFTGIQAHGDPYRWVGLLIDHEGGRRSQAAISGHTGLPEGAMKVDLELYGPAGSMMLDAISGRSGRVLANVASEFAHICRTGSRHELDARHALDLQRWIDIIERQLTSGG